MPRKLRLLIAALASAALILVAPVASAPGQQWAAASPGAGDLSECLRRGQALEGQRRWAEAVTHYEQALRQFPGDGKLKQQFFLARLHYDVTRRYGDRSFREGLSEMSFAAAVDLYTEVLLKIQAHYVEAPRWKELVECGTTGLGIALTESAFLESAAPRPDAQSLEAFRDELRRLLAAGPLESQEEARGTVIAAATLAQRRLGLRQSAVVMEYVCGAANSLDAYSTYLTPDQLAEVYSQIEGNFVGLGVELKAQDGVLLIVRVIPNSPAKRSGLRDGDRIAAIDGRATRQLSADQAANLLQGKPDSLVELVIERPGSEARKVVVRRERVEVPSVDDARILDANRAVAYLKLSCFQKSTHREVDEALWELHRAGMKALVIDLRGNPGGLLVSAVEVADLFLERGVIVTTHGRNAYEDFTYAAREAGTWRVPLVVLIDQESASAAEIFAGAIRDHNRGTIVGQRSFGKGSVQGIFPLKTGNAGVRLTTAKFYSPGRRPYSDEGVQPHVVVRQAAKPVASPAGSLPDPGQSDPALAAAIQVAVDPVAQR